MAMPITSTTPLSPASPAPVTAAGGPGLNALHFAVVIGIDVYPSIRDLKLARADAMGMSEWLLSPAGGKVPKENLYLIEVEASKVKSDEPEPTRQRVNDALQKIINAMLAQLPAGSPKRDESRLYLYLSGHGVSTAAQESLVLMANASSQRSGENIACNEYASFFRTWGLFREVVVFADCCRSASWRAAVSPPPWDTPSKSLGPVNSMLGYATTFDTLAYEPVDGGADDPDALRGYFTRALLEGLTGSAGDGGVVDSNSLARYVNARVRDLSKDRLVQQVPSISADPAAPIVFCRGVPAPEWSVTVRFPAGTPPHAELLDGQFNVVQTFDAAPAPWLLRLSKGIYQVRSTAPGAPPFTESGIVRVLGGDVDVQL